MYVTHTHYYTMIVYFFRTVITNYSFNFTTTNYRLKTVYEKHSYNKTVYKNRVFTNIKINYFVLTHYVMEVIYKANVF